MTAGRVDLALGWGSVSVLTYLPEAAPRADVLLLHGGGLDNAWLSWSGLGPAFAAAGYRVWAPDLPGFGLSAPAPWPATQERLVDLVADLVGALGLHRPVLGGLSLGGGMALGHALSRDADLSGLLLLGSYGLTDQLYTGPLAAWEQRCTYWATRSGLLSAAQRGIARNRWALAASLSGHALVSDRRRLTPELRAGIAEEASRPDAFVAFSQWQRDQIGPTRLRTDYSPRLGELEVPTLLVHGEGDPGVPIAAARRAAATIAGAELLAVPRGGHWVQRDSPALVAEGVVDFLAPLDLNPLV